jgi:hypothetical protein
LTYINKQEAQLNEVEIQKKELTTKYFTWSIGLSVCRFVVIDIDQI